MTRRLVLTLTLLLGLALAATAHDAPAGRWTLAQVTPVSESIQCLLNAEVKDGKPVITVLSTPANTEVVISDLKHDGDEISLTVKTTRTIQDRKINQEQTFVGTMTGDGKVILGSLGDDRFLTRAKLTKTDKEKLEPSEMFVRKPVEAYTKAMAVANKPLQLRMQIQREQDADKKKELQDQLAEATKMVAEEGHKLHREVVANHADSPAAFDSALYLLRGGARMNLTPDEAGKLVEIILKQSEPYGKRFVHFQRLQLAEMLLTQKGQESNALTLIEPVVKELKETAKAAQQVRVLNAYRNALEKANRPDDLKGVEARLAKLDKALDDEYLATVPPFKPAAFGGRKDKAANLVCVMELFTGAQCPPCVAADVAFDALEKAYPPKDLVLLQYHMHIPGPDPLTNLDSIARWDYYKAKFPENVRGTPTTLFNGKPAAGGGGGMANAEAKFGQYQKIIDEALEKTSPLKLTGKATRNGDKVEVAVEVAGAEPVGEDLRLRFVLVENKVKYVGGNGLRFHHQVVRALPGGPAGIVIKEKNMRHVETADISQIRKGLTTYLDDYAANRPFPNKSRPMELGHLKVIALVQNDESREILQAVSFDVDGK